MPPRDPAAYRRIHRVRNGQQKTVPIPAPVLAEALALASDGPIARHLGPEMVDAVKAAAGLTEQQA